MKHRTNIVPALLVICLAALTGCQQDLTPITRAIEAIGGRVTTAQTAADNAQRTANTAQQTANGAVSAITADGGVNNQVTELQRRIRELEACNPASPNYGTADCDHDFVSNAADACPQQSRGDDESMYVATYTRRGCRDSDQDGDGVGDSQDMCPTVAEGEHADSARPGCADVDTDGDGVFDSGDECHLVAKGEHPDGEHEGCPTGTTPDPDTDGDGVRDYRDQCVNEVVGDEPHPTRLGCGDTDTDRDGWVDRWDGCVTRPVRNESTTPDAPEGSNTFPGCPVDATPDPDRMPNATMNNVVADGGAPVTDASTTPDAGQPQAATDPATDGASTRVVQGDPPTPAADPAPTAPPATEPAVASSETTNGNAVMGAIGDNASAATRFCTLDRRALAAIQLAGASECGRTERWCFRLVNLDVMPTACDPRTPAPGCVTAGGSMNVCRPGAESVMVVRYGAALQDRTPAGVAAAVTAQSQPRRHASRHRGPSRHGIAFGWGGVSVY